MTGNLLKKEMLNFHNKYSYMIKQAVQPNKKGRVLCGFRSYIIRHWFGVTGSHDMEPIENKC